MPIGIGDLVCLYRRRNKGFGMVIEVIRDIEKRANIDGSKYIQDMAKLVEYGERKKYKDDTFKETKDKEALELFWHYHYNIHSLKVKRQFAKVTWFKRPGSYETLTIRDDMAWYPSDWLKKHN